MVQLTVEFLPIFPVVQWIFSNFCLGDYYALRNCVLFVQFRKCEKQSYRSSAFSSTKSNTPPWVFFLFFKFANDTKSRNASHIQNRKAFTHLRPCQTSLTELFAKIMYKLKPLTIFVKSAFTNLRNLNFEPSLKLRWCRVWDFDGSQIPLTTGGFELRTSYMQCIKILSTAPSQSHYRCLT